MLTVIRAGGDGPSIPAEGTFTGGAWRDATGVVNEHVGVGRVVFGPCSRTHWHTHEGGQLLLIVAGEGFVADESEAVRVREGDMVWTPPGVRHWHGACPDRVMVHTAIALGSTEWQDAVTDEQYDAAGG